MDKFCSDLEEFLFGDSLGEEIGKVVLAWSPDDCISSFFNLLPGPVELGVDGACLLDQHFIVGNAFSTQIVRFNRDCALRPSKSFKDLYVVQASNSHFENSDVLSVANRRTDDFDLV